MWIHWSQVIKSLTCKRNLKCGKNYLFICGLLQLFKKLNFYHFMLKTFGNDHGFNFWCVIATSKYINTYIIHRVKIIVIIVSSSLEEEKEKEEEKKGEEHNMKKQQ